MSLEKKSFENPAGFLMVFLGVIFLIIGLIVIFEPHVVGQYDYYCESGETVEVWDVLDGDRDCDDGSDELNNERNQEIKDNSDYEKSTMGKHERYAAIWCCSGFILILIADSVFGFFDYGESSRVISSNVKSNDEKNNATKKNYTDSMVTKMTRIYNAKPTRKTVESLAAEFDKTEASIIAKLRSLGIYQPENAKLKLIKELKKEGITANKNWKLGTLQNRLAQIKSLKKSTTKRKSTAKKKTTTKSKVEEEKYHWCSTCGSTKKQVNQCPKCKKSMCERCRGDVEYSYFTVTKKGFIMNKGYHTFTGKKMCKKCSYASKNWMSHEA